MRHARSRAARKGRKINLNIVVLPATSAQREPDPLFYFAGGPGSSATEDSPGIAQIFAKIREHRDLVFVDQRGTGGSNPLNCDFFNPNDSQSYFGYFFPLEDIRKCRTQLEPKADLKLYTTTIAMDDIDDARAALGYDRILRNPRSVDLPQTTSATRAHRNTARRLANKPVDAARLSAGH